MTELQHPAKVSLKNSSYTLKDLLVSYVKDSLETVTKFLSPLSSCASLYLTRASTPP